MNVDGANSESSASTNTLDIKTEVMNFRVPVQQQELNELKFVKDMVISLTHHFHGSSSSEGEDICTRDHSLALGLHSSLKVVHVLLVTHPYLSM